MEHKDEVSATCRCSIKDGFESRENGDWSLTDPQKPVVKQVRMPVVVAIQASTFDTPACTVGSDAQTIGWSTENSVSLVSTGRRLAIVKSSRADDETKA